MVIKKFRLHAIIFILDNTTFHEFFTRNSHRKHLSSTRLLRSTSAYCKTGSGLLFGGTGRDNGHIRSFQLDELGLQNSESQIVKINQQFIARSSYFSCFSDVEWYISYPHMGKNGNNPHFHVRLPADGPKDIERIRKRIKTAGYTGNKQFSIKYMQIGVQCGIQYCSREGTTPTLVWDHIASSPVCDEKRD